MSKYEPLSRYLAAHTRNAVTLTFSEINNLVQGGLPQSAYDHRPWWANRHDGRGAQNLAWQSVGWESGEVDMGRGTVTFTRVAERLPELTESLYVRPLSIEDAKLGLAAKFGVDVSAITISINA